MSSLRLGVSGLLMLIGVLVASSPPQAADGNLPASLTFNISSGGYPPFTIREPDGRIHGIFWDVLNEVTQRHGIDLEAAELPPKRSDNALLRGDIDLTMRAIEWTRKPERFVFTEPVMTTADAVFTRRNEDLRIRQPRDLEGKMVLTRLGFHYPDLVTVLDSGKVETVEVQDYQSLFKRLSVPGRFDAGVVNREAGRWLLRKKGWQDQFEEQPITLSPTPYRFMLAPENQALADLLDREISALRTSGRLDEIIDRYF